MPMKHLQILGPMTLAATVAAWIVAAVVASRRSRRRRRRLKANQLRSRVRLHALAVDVFKQRLVADDLARPDRRLLEHLRRQSWAKAHGSVANVVYIRDECRICWRNYLRGMCDSVPCTGLSTTISFKFHQPIYRLLAHRSPRFSEVFVAALLRKCAAYVCRCSIALWFCMPELTEI
jgi:hypothetical protein